jgi:hypothetical protein
MMKKLPDHIRQRVFNLMNYMWKTKYIPSLWKDRWILPTIPKSATSNTIDKMRPKALYEVTRKIWTSIVLSRRQPILMRHNIVNKSQNGFHRERSGDTALFQLINVIEEAIELNIHSITHHGISK